MIGVFNTIKIGGKELLAPNDLTLQREDVYAAEYTTCTGKTIADVIGWKYSDTTLKWDILPEDMMTKITGLTGEVDFIFADSDGEHTEKIIRKGFNNTPTRLTKNGKTVWTGVELEIAFINTHGND